MFIKRFFNIAILMFFQMAFSQVKVPDTIYVYDKGIVHDTIYLPKVPSLNELKIDKAIYKVDPITNKGSIILTSEDKSIAIPIENTIENTLSTTMNKISENLNPPLNIEILHKINYGLEINAGFSKNNFSLNTIAKGYGVGFFIRKNILKNNFAIEFEPNYKYIVDDNFLKEGYYVNQNIVLKLLETVNHRSQFNFPLHFYWNLGKIKPSIGGFYALNYASAEFLNSTGNLPLTLDEKASYQMAFSEIGYNLGLRFDWTNRIAFAFRFSDAKAGNIKFKKSGGNESVFYISNLDFKETLLTFSIQYNFRNSK